MSKDLISKDEVRFVRNPRAKRYIVRVDTKGRITLTLPKRGSMRYALKFANEHLDWIRERQNLAVKEKTADARLGFGQRILFRGEWHELILEKDCGRPVMIFANQRLFIADENMDLRRPLRTLMMEMARIEFPPKVMEYAERFALTVKRVSVRGQKTRWGSCSSAGTISLNWRLLQAPTGARDYVIIHELMHLFEMNHSPRFWSLVADACPDYSFWKKWLDEHQSEMSW